MFDSLAEQIRHDEHEQVSDRERLVRWVLVAVVSVAVFGGLYYVVQMID